MKRATEQDQMRRTFGAQTLPEAERKARVRSLFGRIARSHDLRNDLMSFGTHRF